MKNQLIFGLDIGTTSIGWAAINADPQKIAIENPEQSQIIASGVYIFPVGVNEDQFAKKGIGEPKNATRREKRGIRRRLHRIKQRKQQLKKALMQYELPLPATPNSPDAIYEWRAKALKEQIELAQLTAILWQFANRRGFLSNRKEKTKEDDKGKVKTGIEELQQEIEKSGCQTAGEYFYYLITQNKESHNPTAPTKRIRKRYMHRSMYMQEFDAIWKQQQKYYPQLTGNAENPDKKSLWYIIRNKIIFYQRPLKSQRHTIGKCKFEPTKDVEKTPYKYNTNYSLRSCKKKWYSPTTNTQKK